MDGNGNSLNMAYDDWKTALTDLFPAQSALTRVARVFEPITGLCEQIPPMYTIVDVIDKILHRYPSVTPRDIEEFAREKGMRLYLFAEDPRMAITKTSFPILQRKDIICDYQLGISTECSRKKATKSFEKGTWNVNENLERLEKSNQVYVEIREDGYNLRTSLRSFIKHGKRGDTLVLRQDIYSMFNTKYRERYGKRLEEKGLKIHPSSYN